MEENELNTKLKDVLDMTVFSQLLEMDEEEHRRKSSTALYGFIENAEGEMGDMIYALYVLIPHANLPWSSTIVRMHDLMLFTAADWHANENVLLSSSKGDFNSLLSIAKSLQQYAAALGFYKVRESCETFEESVR